jgi:hypothetical protein
MTANRAWVKRNLGFDPIATPAPAATFAFKPALAPRPQPEDFVMARHRANTWPRPGTFSRPMPGSFPRTTRVRRASWSAMACRRRS